MSEFFHASIEYLYCFEITLLLLIDLSIFKGLYWFLVSRTNIEIIIRNYDKKNFYGIGINCGKLSIGDQNNQNYIL